MVKILVNGLGEREFWGGTHIYILWVVGLIFGELCRMIDFYVGNQYGLINRRFSEYERFISNY